MYGKLQQHLQQELADIKAAGLYKSERIIVSEQGDRNYLKHRAKCIKLLCQ